MRFIIPIGSLMFHTYLHGRERKTERVSVCFCIIYWVPVCIRCWDAYAHMESLACASMCLCVSSAVHVLACVALSYQKLSAHLHFCRAVSRADHVSACHSVSSVYGHEHASAFVCLYRELLVHLHLSAIWRTEHACAFVGLYQYLSVHLHLLACVKS